MTPLLGFLIALAVGLTGVGGGSLTAPLLILGLGLPPTVAVGTSLAFATVIKLVAVPMYWRRGQVHWPSALRLLLGGIPAVLAGGILLSKAGQKGAVLLVIGVIIVFFSIINLVRVFFPAPARRPRPGCLNWIGIPIGLEVGFSSAGAGALGSLALLHCTALSPAAVVGTDLVFGLAISTAGGLFHAASGSVDYALLAQLCVGGVAGVIAGATWANRLPAPRLRAALAVFLVILGVRLCWSGWAGQ